MGKHDAGDLKELVTIITSMHKKGLSCSDCMLAAEIKRYLYWRVFVTARELIMQATTDSYVPKFPYWWSTEFYLIAKRSHATSEHKSNLHVSPHIAQPCLASTESCPYTWPELARCNF